MAGWWAGRLNICLLLWAGEHLSFYQRLGGIKVLFPAGTDRSGHFPPAIIFLQCASFPWLLLLFHSDNWIPRYKMWAGKLRRSMKCKRESCLFFYFLSERLEFHRGEGRKTTNREPNSRDVNSHQTKEGFCELAYLKTQKSPHLISVFSLSCVF